MEPTKKQVRATLPLLKAPITNITEGGFTILIGAHYGSPTSIKVTCDTRQLDLRDGDQLTLFTEVLIKPAQGNG